jgi:hypothetical protein
MVHGWEGGVLMAEVEKSEKITTSIDETGCGPDHRLAAEPPVIVAMVGSMHPDEKCRADAQKVLDRLLWHGQGRPGG